MAKFVMVQGTSSGAGKSLIVAALCRIFARRGIDVAPFKAQNMSLNSGVSVDGGEMGRAQIVQAIASMRPPEVLMNPVLLKPEGDAKSQVIVMGKPRGSMSAHDYYSVGREDLWSIVASAVFELSRKAELIVIEGAGSPVEINLRDKDIVNMRVAKFVKSPVLLVGDIELGGVFASIYGTIKLLGMDAEYVKGIIINKFRGDMDILRPGLSELEALTKKPIIGVIPHIKHTIDEEDSISEDLDTGDVKKGELKIGVVKLPFMSNYTDFSPFKKEEDVALLYFDAILPPHDIDVVILPGSKNSVRDLEYLKKSGFEGWLKRFRKRGGIIVGICGGYQMLGRTIRDPYKVEFDEGEVKCLGLLDVDTVLEPAKQIYLVKALWNDELEIHGYEIHMGRSFVYSGNYPLIRIVTRNGKSVNVEDGVSSYDETVWGTYIHGIFDDGRFRRHFLNKLRVKKGLSPVEKISDSWFLTLDSEIDRFADVVEKSLNMNMLEEMIGIKDGF